MKQFKIVFSRNGIVSCKPATTEVPLGKHRLLTEYDDRRRLLIHAIVHAKDECEAMEKAREIMVRYANT
jgi:hypothetical protein